jgi:hypothetical protein
MTSRKGEMTSAQLDREFPYQVALPASQCTVNRDAQLIELACIQLEAAPRRHTVRHNDTDYLVFCFAQEFQANMFRELTKGEPFDPQTRGRGRRWHLVRKTRLR